jgi:hypothetical protein
MNESGLLEWKTGRFPARMGLGSYLKKSGQTRTGSGQTGCTRISHLPRCEKNRRFSDSTCLRGAPAAPSSSPILDPLQIGGGIMTRKIVRSWDLDRDFDNIGCRSCFPNQVSVTKSCKLILSNTEKSNTPLIVPPPNKKPPPSSPTLTLNLVSSSQPLKY